MPTFTYRGGACKYMVAIARRFECPTFGSSYAHLPASVDEVWTTFESVDDEPSLLAAFRDGAPRRVFRRDGPRHQRRCLAEFGYLF